jgi:MFS transporter, FSR family, fosmidomycin resistance protein
MKGIGISLLLLWLSHFFMDFFTGIWPMYKTLAEIDITQAGIIVGISGFTGEILQLAFGYFCDRGHRKKVLLFGLLAGSSILWITCTTEIIPCFFLLLFLMIGSGAFHPASAGLASLLSQAHKGKVMLTYASGGALGLGVSQIAFIHLTERFNGHAFAIFLPLALLFVAILWHSFPHIPVASPALPFKSIFKPLMNYKRPLLLLYFSQIATQALAMAFMFLLPDFLQANECHTWLCRGGGQLCYVVGAALMMIPAGYLCDKYDQKRVLLAVLCGAITLLYLFLSQTDLSFQGTVILLTVLGAFIGIINPIVVSWGNRLVPESPSTVSALLMGFAWCFGNLGPAAAGLITRFFPENPFTHTLFVTGSLLFVIFLLILLMPRPEKSFANIAPDQ